MSSETMNTATAATPEAFQPEQGPSTPLVVVDNASMRYAVRSASASSTSKGGLRKRLRRSSGNVTNEVDALRPLSFVVHQGESIGIIGTNGSGKSTLMNMITGKLPPTTGSVYASSTPTLLGVNAALVKTISGHDNITLGCLAMGMSHSEIEAKRQSIVELSGLQRALHLPLRAYSSGMASRLQFAIATSVDPEILIIDEALNTGDAQFKDRTRARIDELRLNAGCVFLVSHSLKTIKSISTRVLWIEQGDLIQDGDPKLTVAKYVKYTRHLMRDQHEEAQAYLQQCKKNLVKTQVRWN